MKKLIIKIGNETHELPYNGEAYSVEVSDKYLPKAGDCVKVECKYINKTSYYWFKVKEVSNAMVRFSLSVGEDLDISKKVFCFYAMNKNRIYTQIPPEELKAKYAKAGYDWDYESDTIKPLKWMPKDGEKIWWVNSIFEPIKHIFNKDNTSFQLMLEKGLLFKTKEECQKFADYCLEYFKK